MNQIKTKDNVRFEDPLSEYVTLRVTVKEKIQLDAISRENYISISELTRNLIRDHISKYAISKNLKKILHISNEIDKILLEKRIISSRNETNLSKMREILTDFEFFLEEHPKKINHDEFENRQQEIESLLKLIYEEDYFLAAQLDSQVRRIFKTRSYKAHIQEKIC